MISLNHSVSSVMLLPAGTIFESDVNYNLTFVLQILLDFTTKVCHQLHWVPLKEPIYLVMDNAGGNRVQGKRRVYLRDDDKIVIIQQSACSLEVNTLDLGIWF